MRGTSIDATVAMSFCPTQGGFIVSSIRVNMMHSPIISL